MTMKNPIITGNQRRVVALRIRTGLKAGSLTDGVRLNHNQTQVQA